MDAESKKILSAMKKAGKPLRPGDIADATALDKNDVSKLLKKMKDDGLVTSPKRCFYAPK